MAMPSIIDSHTHVQFPTYNDDRDKVIKRSLDAGIWMVNIGTQESTSQDAIALSEKYPEGVYATVGFHPGHAGASHHDEWEKAAPSEEVFDIDRLRALARHPKVVGIGECGLDFYRIQDSAVRIRQEEIFRAQISLAHELQKPIAIHCREAFSDLIRVLNTESLLLNLGSAGVIHFFSGTVEEAKQLMDLGFYLGFGGVVTFAKAYESVVREVPLGRIVLETDAPYVAPVPYRGKRNEPLYIETVAAKIAEWKAVSFDEVRRVTTENARALFGI